MTDTTTTTTTTLPLAPGAWTLDQFHSSVGFSIRHLGISKVRGTFERFDVAVTVGETLDDCRVAATIDVASIDTRNPDRDQHVLASDLLDVASRPTMTYTSTNIHLTDGEWTLIGDLTIGEVTVPVALDLEFGGLQEFPMDGSTHAGFEARGVIDRHDFGLRFGALDGGLGRKVAIELDIQLVAPRS